MSLVNKLLFAAILCIGVILRFYQLTSVPPSLSHDESAIAYNAYSVWKTGADEYGRKYPLLYRSFDDYKLPGMVYATVPFVALFGRSTIAARLPSALLGSLTIIAMYLLATELLGSRRWMTIGKTRFDAALLPALAIAVSPWHVNFSRQLFESNGAVFFFTLGTYFLLKSFRRYPAIVAAGILYVIALYFYYSVRLVIPFVALGYLILRWKHVFSDWKTSLIALILSATLFVPIGREMLTPGGWERISIVSVVNDGNYIARRDAYVTKLAAQPTLWNKIVYNRRMALLETVVENYWKNIAPHNLFVTGTGTYGALFPLDALLVPLGIIMLWRLGTYSFILVVIWLITSFFPGAFSVNQPNTLRTLIAAPVFALLAGLGAIEAYARAKTVRYGTTVVTAGILLMMCFAFPKFLSAYFIDNPTHNAVAFADGNRQMVDYVRSHETKYDRIYISGYYWRPYIFMLYWGGIDPSDYAANGFREHYGKYYFTSASWDTNGTKLLDPNVSLAKLSGDATTLFILSPQEYTVHQNELRTLDSIDGAVAKNVFIAATLR